MTDEIDLGGWLLRKLAESPPGQTFWEGTWSVPAERPDGTIRYFICCAAESAPSPEQLAFCGRIQAIASTCLDVARMFLLREIEVSPQRFGLTDDEASDLARGHPDQLPFGGPELTFYGGEEWFVRFTETRLSGCAHLGLGVDFSGESPLHAHCLDREADEGA
ncbi:MAG: hypothetical protein J0L92_30425 [Deltaproteobacteria bacterium]|nr:hypothetical protein [Deltaproteobacteria bacterium]